MNTIFAKGTKWIGRAALATAILGGFLAFLGAGTASAHPRVYVYGYARPYPVYAGPRYYYGPRPVYVGPVYRPYGYYEPYRAHRIWDERARSRRHR